LTNTIILQLKTIGGTNEEANNISIEVKKCPAPQYFTTTKVFSNKPI